MSHSESTTYRKLYECMKAERDNWKAERDNWKDEYENVCKFATDYEQQRDALRAQLTVAVDALEHVVYAPVNLHNGVGACIPAAVQEVARGALASLQPKAGEE